MTTRSKSHVPIHRIKVGDVVQLTHGELRLTARVIEDRGPIGTADRRMLRVRVVDEHGNDEWAFEVPEDEVTPSVD